MKKIDVIIGVRPDFIRVSALVMTLQDFEDSLDIRIIHTGQHYDPELNQNILDQFPLTQIHSFLDFNMIEGVGKLSSVMLSYENQIRIDKPDYVLVMGNSDSALACAMVAARSHIPIIHLDAGIRFNDIRPVEEQNDMLIDRLSSYLLTSNEESMINLIREGFDSQQIVEVGNIRADAVFMSLGYAEDSEVLDRLGLEENNYILVTLHHDHILNNIEFLAPFFVMLENLSERLKIIVILHPKTLHILEDLPEVMLDPGLNLHFISSQNYQDLLKLLKNTAVLVTDSQGLQEEASILGVQCLTVGPSTNRLVTLSKGSNTLIGLNVNEIQSKIVSIIEGDQIDSIPIDNWEGKAGQRIAKFLTELD